MELVVSIKQRGQVLDIGGEELLKLAILQDIAHDRVRVAYLLELALAGRTLAARRLFLPFRREAELVEEHLAQLPRRTDVELASRRFIDAFFYFLELFCVTLLQLGKHRSVDKHAVRLHLPQERDEWPLNALVHLLYPPGRTEEPVELCICFGKGCLLCVCENVVERRIRKVGVEEPELDLSPSKLLLRHVLLLCFKCSFLSAVIGLARRLGEHRARTLFKRPEAELVEER